MLIGTTILLDNQAGELEVTGLGNVLFLPPTVFSHLTLLPIQPPAVWALPETTYTPASQRGLCLQCFPSILVFLLWRLRTLHAQIQKPSTALSVGWQLNEKGSSAKPTSHFRPWWKPEHMAPSWTKRSLSSFLMTLPGLYPATYTLIIANIDDLWCVTHCSKHLAHVGLFNSHNNLWGKF